MKTLVLLLFWCLSCSLSLAQFVDKKPNIIWITVEDMSPRLACYGDKIAYTPNLDKLASESIVFENCYPFQVLVPQVAQQSLQGYIRAATVLNTCETCSALQHLKA